MAAKLIKGTKFEDTAKGQRLYAEDLLKKNPKLAFKATPASVVKARDERGLRWVRIAVFASITETEARELYQRGAGRPASRLPGGKTPAKPAPAKPAAKKPAPKSVAKSARAGKPRVVRSKAPKPPAEVEGDPAAGQLGALDTPDKARAYAAA